MIMKIQRCSVYEFSKKKTVFKALKIEKKQNRSIGWRNKICRLRSDRRGNIQISIEARIFKWKKLRTSEKKKKIQFRMSFESA